MRVFMRRPVICTPRLMIDFLEEDRRGARHRVRHRAQLRRGRLGRRRRADGLPLRLALSPRRSRDALSAEARAALRRRLQRLCDVRRSAEGGVPRHGCAPLRRRRDGRDDGLCRGGRLGRGASARSARSASSATPPTRRRIISATSAGRGTMPHALIGYAGSTVRAAEMFHETFPDEPLTVLVDYFGREVTDALAVCRRFPELAARGHALGPARHPWRPLRRGARPRALLRVLERHAPQAIRGYRTEPELRYLVGTGVSAAALWHVRRAPRRGGLRQGARSSPARASPPRNAA